MLLSQLLHSEQILFNLVVDNKTMLFTKIAEFAAEKTNISAKEIFSALQEREEHGSTGLGYGVAIPHGRLKDLKRPFVVAIKCAQALDFQSIDNIPVRIILVLLVPKKATEQHLALLGEIAQIFSSQTRRQQLENAPTSSEFLQLLQE